MDVIVMAAGLGTRLGELTRDLPKALIEPAGETLLSLALHSFGSRPWVERIVVVTGFERQKVRDHLALLPCAKPVVEAFNPDFRKGNFYSLYRGLSELRSSSWLVTNVDHIFPQALLDQAFANHRGVSAVCDSDRELQPDCMKVQAQDLRVRAMSKKLSSWTHGYIGMTFVHDEGAPAYREAVSRVHARGQLQAVAEDVLGELARSENPDHWPRVDLVNGYAWFEVDDARDLKRAREHLVCNADTDRQRGRADRC
jgi:choline kinase